MTFAYTSQKNRNSNTDIWQSSQEGVDSLPEVTFYTLHSRLKALRRQWEQTFTLAKMCLSPVFQPSIGVRPMPTERTQHKVMMAFALCPVTRLVYLKRLRGWTCQRNTHTGLASLSGVGSAGKTNICGFEWGENGDTFKCDCIVYLMKDRETKT